MITLLIGAKGSGKTKRMLDMLNETLDLAKGNVVCVEKEKILTYNVNYRARLVVTDEFSISGFESFFGFLSGLCAGNHDITDVFVDATLRIGSRDVNELAAFLEKINSIPVFTEINFVFTVSAEKDTLPEKVFEFCKMA